MDLVPEDQDHILESNAVHMKSENRQKLELRRVCCPKERETEVEKMLQDGGNTRSIEEREGEMQVESRC